MSIRYIKFAEALFTLGLFILSLFIIFFIESFSSFSKYNSSRLTISLLSRSTNLTLFLSIASKVSANILATAIIDLFFPSLLTILRYLDLNLFVYFISECTVSAKKNLNMEGPCFVIWSITFFSRDEYSLGVNPVYIANFSLLRNLIYCSFF